MYVRAGGRIQARDLLRGERLRVRLTDAGGLDRVAGDHEPGVDGDAELDLGPILELTPVGSTLGRGQVVVPHPEPVEARGRRGAGDDARPAHREPRRKRAVDDLVPDVRVAR